MAVLRFDGAGGKHYRPLSAIPDGWKIGDPPAPLPLYRLEDGLRRGSGSLRLIS